VAGLALGIPMLANQREVGLAVIEPHFLPACGDVTIVTYLAKTSLVPVILAVTSDTGRRCIPRWHAMLVAIPAFDIRLRMTAGQRKIRPLMIECSTIQIHNLGLASFMFGMTITARMLPHSSVVPGFHFYIVCYRLMVMAIQAQIILFAALERLVTGLALVFELRMSLDQVAGCNHCVERAHVRPCRCCYNQHKKHDPPFLHSRNLFLESLDS